jgi:NAD(P)-dependent dehydrogenase (short-subunit alcohol dehydrogenase family)
VSRRALVTGGADGIGLALARALTGDGARVAILDIRKEAARTAAAELPGAIALAADVADPASLADAAAEVQAAWGGLDILWINAGVAAPSKVADAGPSTVQWVYGVNVLGIVWTANAFLPLLRAGTDPAVGVTCSTAALASPGGLSLYGASKHAALGLAEALRSDLAGEGIGVTLFCPGLLASNIWDAARARPDRHGGVLRADPALAGRWLTAEPPEAAVSAALAVMAQGGGYAVHLTTPDSEPAFEARVAAIRQAMADGRA